MSRAQALMICLLLGVCLGILTACGEKVLEAPEAGDVVHVPAFEWRVRDQPALEASYMASTGVVLSSDQRLEGFAGQSTDGTKVVYTKPPRYVDDSVACTLGHEVMHLALGRYHQ